MSPRYQNQRNSPSRKAAKTAASLPVLHPHAAGIDIGAREIYVAVPPDRDPQPVRTFATFTDDLHALRDWLLACGVTTVALESTGVYWIPLFQILEAAGLEVCLVNARHAKNLHRFRRASQRGYSVARNQGSKNTRSARVES